MMNFILKNIWFNPKRVFRFLIVENKRKYDFLLLLIAGIAFSYYKAINKNIGDEVTLDHILLVRTTIGGLLSFIGLNLFTYLWSVTGKWLGGNAKVVDFRSILATAVIPSIVGLLLLVPGIFIFGIDLFSSTLSIDEKWYSILYYLFIGVYYVLHLWFVVILVKGVKTIQHFSTLRALANLILPSITLFILGALLIILFSSF